MTNATILMILDFLSMSVSVWQCIIGFLFVWLCVCLCVYVFLCVCVTVSSMVLLCRWKLNTSSFCSRFWFLFTKRGHSACTTHRSVIIIVIIVKFTAWPWVSCSVTASKQQLYRPRFKNQRWERSHVQFSFTLCCHSNTGITPDVFFLL